MRKIEGKDFAKFRSVAHLWGAHMWMAGLCGQSEARRQMGMKRGTKRFLRYAALLQQFGLEETTPRTNERVMHALLDEEMVWRVPANTRPVKAKELPGLSSEMLAFLGDYERY